MRNDLIYFSSPTYNIENPIRTIPLSRLFRITETHGPLLPTGIDLITAWIRNYIHHKNGMKYFIHCQIKGQSKIIILGWRQDAFLPI